MDPLAGLGLLLPVSGPTTSHTHPGSISTFRNSANKDTNLDEEFNCGENCNVHFVPFDIKSSFWAGGEEICGKFFSLSKIEGVDDHFFYAPVAVKSF